MSYTREQIDQVEANTAVIKDVFNDVMNRCDKLQNWYYDARRHLRYWCDDLENSSDLTLEQYEKYFEVAEFLGDRPQGTINGMQRDFDRLKLKTIGL